MAHIIWAPRAFADFENLLDYIAKNEPATARRFGQKVLARIESLADFPDSGSFVPEDETLTYREVFQGPYRIIFRREPSHIVIVAVRSFNTAKSISATRVETTLTPASEARSETKNRFANFVACLTIGICLRG